VIATTTALHHTVVRRKGALEYERASLRRCATGGHASHAAAVTATTAGDSTAGLGGEAVGEGADCEHRRRRRRRRSLVLL